MDEESATRALRENLLLEEFYVKKLADGSTIGLPDTFIAKDKKGFFAEVKYIETVFYPKTFKKWSALKPNGHSVQLTTMVQMDWHFIARYIFIFNVKDHGILYCKFLPSILLEHMRKDTPAQLPKLLPLNLFIQDLKILLQVT